MTPDEVLVEALQQHLELPVRLMLEGDPEFDAVIGSMTPTPSHKGETAMRYATTAGQTTRVAAAMPSGAWAIWETSETLSEATIKHAQTVLLLVNTDDERNQLLSEADALATQVVNDFEELSLLRSLAAKMELPETGVGVTEMVRNCLGPLAHGLGAESVAAVIYQDAVLYQADGEASATVNWSGEPIVSDDIIESLIDSHGDSANDRPLIQNPEEGTQLQLHANSINEFVLMACRSEGRLHGWLIACNRVGNEADDVPWAQRGFTTVQASLLETATHQLAAQIHNMRLLRQKEALYTDVVRALVNAVEARDPYTCGHSERVAQFAKCLGKVIGEDEVGCDRIYLTGLLHDIGKIAVPDGVLRKPGDLDRSERAIIETHTEAGWRILHELEALRDVLPGVLYHHEHFDGNGYPDGLVGQNIPLDGRILAVCDAYDAMTSDRPYREGMPIERAIEILNGGSGRYWDPMIVDAFIENIDEMDQIRRNHRPRQHAQRPVPMNGQPIYQ
ncbi:MAG: HD-GYP domain-containing protein [Planctomycetota bacterium]